MAADQKARARLDALEARVTALEQQEPPRFFPGGSWRPYAATSPFNTPLVNPQHKTSVVTSRSVRPIKQAAVPEWNRPVYFALGSDPIVTVANQGMYGTHPLAGQALHLPAEAVPSGGTDGHLCVVDGVWEYDFWQVELQGSVVTSSWGGKTRIDGDGLGAGATAAGFGLAAGHVRAPELAAGEIRHALTLTADYCNGEIIPPAQGSAGRVAPVGDRTGRPGMGQRFWLDYTDAQINAINPAWLRPFAKALKVYGGYVGDTGGGFIGIESPLSHTAFGLPDPWLSVGLPTWHNSAAGRDEAILDFRAGVDWDRLKAIA